MKRTTENWTMKYDNKNWNIEVKCNSHHETHIE